MKPECLNSRDCTNRECHFKHPCQLFATDLEFTLKALIKGAVCANCEKRLAWKFVNSAEKPARGVDGFKEYDYGTFVEVIPCQCGSKE